MKESVHNIYFSAVFKCVPKGLIDIELTTVEILIFTRFPQIFSQSKFASFIWDIRIPNHNSPTTNVFSCYSLIFSKNTKYKIFSINSALFVNVHPYVKQQLVTSSTKYFSCDTKLLCCLL